MMRHSTVELRVRERIFLNMTEAKIPYRRPMAMEQMPSSMKSPMISNGAVHVISFSSSPKKNLSTVLNRMMATASLTIPSPKRRLNRVGYSSYLTMEMAAITSVEHRREDIRRISGVDKTRSFHTLSNKKIR